MKTRSTLLLVAMISGLVPLLMTGCASNPNPGGSPAPSGIYGTNDTYTPMPMNQAARTDAMRQQYRNEFR
jgi:hypothetical protein